ETALHVAAETQDVFRTKALEAYKGDYVEDSSAMVSLLLDINRKVMSAAGGVVCSPAFLGCYDEDIGTLTYINAGHTPGFLRDEDGVLALEANGLPLGLFSHSTHDAQYCALRPGASVTLVSKGVCDNRVNGKEFGVGA